jgi:hypothetical protein
MARNEKNEVTFFIDRRLGKSIAVALRAAGLEVLTVAAVYGEKTAQTCKDEVWLHDAGTAGWAVLTKDDAIRRPHGEPSPDPAAVSQAGALHPGKRPSFALDSYALRPPRTVGGIVLARGQRGGQSRAERARQLLSGRQALRVDEELDHETIGDGDQKRRHDLRVGR